MASGRWMVTGVAVTVLACANPPQVQADEGDTTLAIMPVFDQLVAWRLPPGFHRAHEASDGDSYVFQATPEGDSLSRWSQLIALTGAAGRAADAKTTPRDFASGIAAGLKQGCPDSYHGIELQAPAVEGYESFAAVISCGDEADGSPAHSKTDLVVVVRGSHDYYTFQWAERGPAQRGPMQIDAGLWSRRLAGLMPIHLCDRITGEKAPYPSCVSRITDLSDADTGDATRKGNGGVSQHVPGQWETAGFVITLQHYVATLATACAPILGATGKDNGLMDVWRDQASNGLFLDTSLAYQAAIYAAIEKASGKQAAQGVLARQMDLVRRLGDDQAMKLLEAGTAKKIDTCRRFKADVRSGAYNIGKRMPFYDTLMEMSRHVSTADTGSGEDH